LSLFPDGLPLGQLKAISQRRRSASNRSKSNQNHASISEKVVKSLQDKSLIESRDGMQCQHAMLRRYAEAKILKSDNKEVLYKKAFNHNDALIDSLHDALMNNVGGDTNNIVYVSANKLKNNFIYAIKYFGCYAGDYEMQLRYLYVVQKVLGGCEQYQALIQAISSIPKGFARSEQDQLFLDILEIYLRYYSGEFIDAYENLSNKITPEDLLLLDYSNFSNRRLALLAMAIYEMEGDVLGSMKVSILEARKDKVYVNGYPNKLYAIGEYDLNIIGRVADSFYKFESQLNLGSLDVEELKEHCNNIYLKDNITRAQCYYTLAKVDELSDEIVESLKVVNPYTAGLKQVILAWKEMDYFKANTLFEMALGNLIHIKYFYIEVLFYYCVFLKDKDEERYLIELNKGKELAEGHCYRFLLHKFIQLELGTEDLYNVKDYPLPDDFPVSEYKKVISFSMNY
jgi:hypothetical protein